MKLWKKIYLVALVVTVVCVNIGIFGIFKVTYTQMLNAEKKHSEAEFGIVRQAIASNIEEMEKSTQLNQDYFGRFIKAYNSYYDENTLIGGIYQKESVNAEALPDQILTGDSGILLNHGDNTCIYVYGSVDLEHPDYRLVMQRSLTDFDDTWDTLWPVYIAGSLVLSIGISIILAFSVRNVMKPVSDISNAVTDIAGGNLSRRVTVKGSNELSRLGSQLNNMTAALENNMNQLEEETRKKEQLINNLTHEMNTPITSIQGFAQYMQIGNLKAAEYQECSEYILNETSRLKNISETLLEMARLDNMKVTKKSFSVAAMAQRISGLYTQECYNRGIQLNMNCESKSFYGNETLLESLIRNLIVNSMHALENIDNPLISVNISGIDELLIEVKDNGCGIPEYAIDNIFDPFYRVSKSRSRASGGSGLGLAFVKTITAIHNGTIEVLSKEKCGTEMIVRLYPNN